MLLSQQTGMFARSYEDKKAIEMIADAGFDAIDYSMFVIKTNDEHPVLGKDFEKYAAELKKVADDRGLPFNQAHAPFPSVIENDDEYNKITFSKIRRSIEFASLLGVKQICVHPVTFRNDEEREFEFNLEFYNSLLPTLKSCGIKIGVENMFWVDKDAQTRRPGACGTSQRMIRLFDELDPEYFTCLLDIGHSGLVGERAENFIKALGQKRLGALHVHDNDYKSDLHAIPFSGSIDWKAVTSALHEINYKGDFTLEADKALHPYPEEFYPEVLSYLCKTGRLLISMIENAE